MQDECGFPTKLLESYWYSEPFKSGPDLKYPLGRVFMSFHIAELSGNADGLDIFQAMPPSLRPLTEAIEHLVKEQRQSLMEESFLIRHAEFISTLIPGCMWKPKAVNIHPTSCPTELRKPKVQEIESHIHIP